MVVLVVIVVVIVEMVAVVMPGGDSGTQSKAES